MLPDRESILSDTISPSVHGSCAIQAQHLAHKIIFSIIPTLLRQGSTLLGISHYTVEWKHVRGSRPSMSARLLSKTRDKAVAMTCTELGRSMPGFPQKFPSLFRISITSNFSGSASSQFITRHTQISK